MLKTKNEINPIAPRANAKMVSMGERKFLIGGMTADKTTCEIYEAKILHEDEEHKVEWRPLKFKNHIFKPRNSYGACGSNTHIYIWGGLETDGMDQKCLAELIEVDVEKGQMRLMPLKENIKIHSASLMYDASNNQLIGLGGTDEKSSMEGLLYTLQLDQSPDSQYEWKRARLDSQFHKGYLWQHTAHLTTKSIFTGNEGKFITVVGGCRFPYSPYNAIVEFDLAQMKATNSSVMKMGLVSHDSLAEDEQRIVIFGGANGGGFNNQTIILQKGEIAYTPGHNAVGCSVCGDDKCRVVVGGVCGPESLNRVIIYPK